MPALPDPLDRLLAPLRASVGTLPSVWVVGGAIAVAIAGSAVLGSGPGLAVELACLAVVLLYCALRPADGLTVLGLAVLPAAVSAIIGDGFDIPRWTVAVPVAVLALVALAAQDRDDRRARGGEAAA
ncbi:hypothetical protein VSS74_14575 [Conexibacter stalactiti]|uniref:Sensor histidine kinase n=1 Tax=Conexibacter stalactiti TaxID=1940611 RepID=A0ABU4HQM1_9ACTN|nr:hypothetical protein [Conexibacter stalactiti]MDW5595572.1 hypothetical protein [Conexibacter stalactiti]MEC5036214.1 hypothetical protein [Conexibacter stalactiti]